MYEMGSRVPDCDASTIFSPARAVFVWGRRRVCALRLREERVRWALTGLETVERSEDADGRSSLSWHWPQKAIRAQAATAASFGCERSRFSMRIWSMVTVMGGRGGRLEDGGAMFLAPLTTTRR